LFASNRPLIKGGKPKEDFDIYISERIGDGWGEPKYPGVIINLSSEELFPSVSADGRYFFFSSTKRGRMDVYWVAVKILEAHKPEESE